MSNYVKKLKTEVTFLPHVVCLSWENPDFEGFNEVIVYRDTSLGYVYSEDSLHFLDEIYRGTAETIYDYDFNESAVLQQNDVPYYHNQSSEERKTRLEGERLYKYYIVTTDIHDNKYGKESLSLTAIPTKYYGMGDYLYNDLPDIYRIEDEKLNYPLKRFIQIFGILFDYIMSVSSINRLLLQPDAVPGDLLPVLHEHYGQEYWHDIPAVFQRKFLSDYGGFIGSKGTVPMLLFLAKELAGGYYDAELETINEDEFEYSIKLLVPMDSPMDLDVKQSIIDRYISNFIPVYASIFTVIAFITDQFLSSFSEFNHTVELSKYRSYRFTGEIDFDGSVYFDKKHELQTQEVL